MRMLSLSEYKGRLLFVMLAGVLVCNAPAHASDKPIVIGMSTSVTGGLSTLASRSVDGAKALVGRVNAQGGIRSRNLRLVVLDDGGDPVKHVDNIRTLVRSEGAVAILGCLTEIVCAAAASAANEMRVPLIGAASGASAQRQAGNMLFPIRPGYKREADELVSQLKAMAVTRMLVITDTDADAATERMAAIKGASAANAMKIVALAVTAGRADMSGRVEATLKENRPQAVFFDLTRPTLDAFAQAKLNENENWPSVIASLSNASFPSLIGVFPKKTVIFTSVVPNPDYGERRLTQEFNEDVKRFAPGGDAITFEGLESYISARVCAEAIRRANSSVDRENIALALRQLTLDVGGFQVSYANGRPTGSTWVDIGMRNANGAFMR